MIGSGAAGAIISEKLCSSGKSVVLLEKGGYYDAEDMNQREVDMMPDRQTRNGLHIWWTAEGNFKGYSDARTDEYV